MLCHRLCLWSGLVRQTLQSIRASILIRWYKSDYHGGLCLWHRLNSAATASAKVNISSKFWPEHSFNQHKYKLFTISQTIFSRSTSTFFRDDVFFLFLFFSFYWIDAYFFKLALYYCQHIQWSAASPDPFTWPEKQSLSDFWSNPFIQLIM